MQIKINPDFWKPSLLHFLFLHPRWFQAAIRGFFSLMLYWNNKPSGQLASILKSCKQLFFQEDFPVLKDHFDLLPL